MLIKRYKIKQDADLNFDELKVIFIMFLRSNYFTPRFYNSLPDNLKKYFETDEVANDEIKSGSWLRNLIGRGK